MINLSLEELRVTEKLRKVKNYKNRYKDESIKILSETERKRSIEKIDSWDRFSKTKVKEIRRNLNETENKNNLSTPEIKEIEKNLLELEMDHFKPKKYYDYDDILNIKE